MNKYLKNLVDVLNSNFEYTLVEFNNVRGLHSEWSLIRKEKDKINVVLFCDVESIKEFDLQDAKGIISNELRCEKEDILLTYLFFDEDYRYLHTENYENYPQCGLILVNSVDKKIIYYTEGTEPIVEEVAKCLYSIEYVNRNRGFKPRESIITYILIAVNIIMYALTAYMSGNIFTSDTYVLVKLGAKVNELISNGEYYRLVTCMFLHGGIVHLGVNMYSLYFLGPIIEKHYKWKKYLVIYFISGIVSSLFSYTFSESVSIGASGAIFGLLGAALIMAYTLKNNVGKMLKGNVISIIVVNLFIGFSIPNVDNFGHLGGLIGGIIISYLLKEKNLLD